MLASVIRLDGLKSASECWRAIDLIESDCRNFVGNGGDWNSGKQCFLKEGAKKKIEALERRANRLSPDEEE